MASKSMSLATQLEHHNQLWKDHAAQRAAPAPQVTEVYDDLKGFLRSTHWSKPYYSALIHNNPQLPYHLLEHVNCTYLSTPGRAPTLLALKQHAQSLAVLISMLAPAQHGGTLDYGRINGDASFAAEQAFDWLNNLGEHYNTEDRAHKKPLNALQNLVKSNGDVTGPKWHCPLDTTGIELPEKHPFPQYRPFETHMTLLMHANEILERLDHEYSAMGGILSIIPLDSEHVEEQKALSQAKTTLVGQWILYTQHLVARMHELEIAYGNSLDLLANEAIVPMQHVSIHGPEGRGGREIVFPQDQWIMANAGEDVFTFIHRMLDRAEAQQDAQDDKFAEHKVLGDAAYVGNEQVKYRGIVKCDLSTRFYRLRGNGHGPLFVLPAFGDRANTKHTRDMENRPTVVAIPQPAMKGETVNAWESKHKDVDDDLLKLSIDKANLEAKVAQLQSSVSMRDREIERLTEMQKQYDDKVNKADKDFAKEVVYLRENVRYFQKHIKDAQDRENALKQEIQNFKDATISSQNNEDTVTNLVSKVNDQQNQIRDLRKRIKEGEAKAEDLQRDNDTLRILNSSPLNESASPSPSQVNQLQSQLKFAQQERQILQQEVHNLKKTKTVKGRILNFPEGFQFGESGTFEDQNQGIIACSSAAYKALIAAEQERNELKRRVDSNVLAAHTTEAELTTVRGECSRLLNENAELRRTGNVTTPTRIINLPWKLQFTSTFRDDNQGLIVLNTEYYDHLLATDHTVQDYKVTVDRLQDQIHRLRAPLNVDVNALSPSFKAKMGQSKVYKDPKSNVVVLTTDYFEALSQGGQDTTTSQKALAEALQKVQTLEQHLKDARDQLAKAQSTEDTQLPDLQNQLDALQQQLSTALAQRAQLEQTIMANADGKPATELQGQVAKVQKELVECTKRTEEREAELKTLEGRYDAALLNERNLRSEVGGLRQKMYDLERQHEQEKQKLAQAAGAAAATTLFGLPASSLSTTPAAAAPQGAKDDALSQAQEEVELYRAELDTLQKLWNNLQTQHVKLQTDLEKAEGDCAEEKAHLEQKLEEHKAEIKVLQMKVIADPNKLQPAMIELEAQRDSAYKMRDNLRLRLRALEKEMGK